MLVYYVIVLYESVHAYIVFFCSYVKNRFGAVVVVVVIVRSWQVVVVMMRVFLQLLQLVWRLLGPSLLTQQNYLIP